MTQTDTDENLRSVRHYCPDKIGIQKQSESPTKLMTLLRNVTHLMILFQ